MSTDTSTTPLPLTGGWEVGQRAQYVARSTTSPGRFAISRGAVEEVTDEWVAVRWDGGGLHRFTPDELDRLHAEGSPAAHRAVFGVDAPLPVAVFARPTDDHGTTVADEVHLDAWTWDDPDTERRMEDLVLLATESGMWGERVINLEVLQDLDDPAYCLTSLGLLDGYRLVGRTIELRELLGPVYDADPATLTGTAMAEKLLAGVSRVAADLAARAACLELALAHPRRGLPEALASTPAASTPAATTATTATTGVEGVRGDG